MAGTALVPIKMFHFRQNNSGGNFDIDDNRGIGPHVWIEAIDRDHAVARAEMIGIYFDGVEQNMDCPCCGDRWSQPYSDKGDELYIDSDYSYTWHDTIYVHKMDGTLERIRQKVD